MLEGKYWKNGVPKAIKLIHSRKMSKQKQSENAGKKKNVKEKWIEKKPKEKKGWNERWRETKKEDQSRIGPSHDEKWSLVWSPWNTVWAYLSFLSEPRT